MGGQPLRDRHFITLARTRCGNGECSGQQAWEDLNANLAMSPSPPQIDGPDLRSPAFDVGTNAAEPPTPDFFSRSRRCFLPALPPHPTCMTRKTKFFEMSLVAHYMMIFSKNIPLHVGSQQGGGNCQMSDQVRVVSQYEFHQHSSGLWRSQRHLSFLNSAKLPTHFSPVKLFTYLSLRIYVTAASLALVTMRRQPPLLQLAPLDNVYCILQLNDIVLQSNVLVVQIAFKFLRCSWHPHASVGASPSG